MHWRYGEVAVLKWHGVISNHHYAVESDMWHLKTKVHMGEKCHLRKTATNYFLESIHESFHAILVG